MLELIYPPMTCGLVKCDTLNGGGHLLLPIVTGNLMKVWVLILTDRQSQ